ncbi:MAG: peptidoglycan-binding protein [Candidatus Paceibacterota bacterium]|jgi:hypothetical protein
MAIFSLRKKKRIWSLIVFLIVAGVAGAVTFVYANYYSWVQMTGSTETTNWSDVVVSSDGMAIYASRPFDGVYRSANGGDTWAKVSGIPASDWRSVSVSTNGANVVAVAYNHDIYYSRDYGITWSVSSAPQDSWVDVASNAEGDYVAVVTNGNHIWISNDYGANWTEKTTGLTTGGWKSIAMSSSGQYMAAVKTNDYVFVSSDYGATWTAKTGSGSRNFYAITSSADGTKLAAAVFGGYIYTSTDSGTTWTQRASLRDWRAITSDPNGLRLAASETDGSIFVSLDSGVTWSEETTGVGASLWRGITFSESGGRIIAASSNNYLFRAIDDTVPTIAEITSSLPHGTFGTGDVIDIDVTFSEPVTTSGASVTLTFSTGGSCSFQVSNSLTATCNYTVAAGETSADLEVTTVSMASGDIRDTAGNILTNFVPSVNLADSKDFVIDTTVSGGGGGYSSLVRSNTTVTNASNTTERTVSATSTAPKTPDIIPQPIVVPVLTPDSKTIPAVFPPLLTKYEFTRDYEFGDRGIEEIRTLQKFLNYIGFTVAETGPGSKGRETAIFGYSTRKALIEFQRAYGITPAVGYYGPITRGIVNSIVSK